MGKKHLFDFDKIKVRGKFATSRIYYLYIGSSKS